jgi:preprotein translocase subunit SecG
MLINFLTVTAALISAFLIGAILIQNPKGGGLDQNFGGQASQIFGASRSSDFIEKATWVLIGTLIMLCIVSVLMIGNGAAATDTPLMSQ